MNELREFKISKNMIMHTIENQAGSIEKALLECIMNGVDAKANTIKIFIHDNGVNYSIEDNGHGFRTKEEILKCFEILGFDHGTAEENDRIYGTFGIGRAQLWAFSKNTWLTNEFKLDVDIANKGLNYTLSENNNVTEGCKIVGEFYDKQTSLDVQNIIRSLKKLALYLPVDLYINEKLVNKNPVKEKWDIETDDAYIKLNDTGDLNIYNLGVFVKTSPNYTFGKGGTIVSKKQLKLNTARNDIIISKCNIWKKIKKYLEENVTKNNIKKNVLTDDMRKNLIIQWISGTVTFQDIYNKKLLKDIKGRYTQIEKITSHNKNYTVSPFYGSQVGEIIHNNKIAFVCSPDVLDWFDIPENEPEQLVVTIRSLLERDRGYTGMVRALKFIPFEKLKTQNSSQYSIINKKEFTRKQKAHHNMLNTINYLICQIMNTQHNYHDKVKQRQILLGKSKQAQAWTDGVTYISVNSEIIQKLIEKEGVNGILKTIYLIIHEYLHQENSDKDHVHSDGFFEKFHDILLNGSTCQDKIHDIALKGMNTLLKNYQHLDLRIPKKIATFEKNQIEYESKAMQYVE